MKKWLISLIVPALIGTAPLSTYAANNQSDYSSVKFYNGVITVRQSQPEKAANRIETRMAYNQKSDDWGRGRRDNNRRERERREERRLMEEREDARYIINRTASVILRAQRTARINRYYAGFARAVAHQNKARELFLARRYREAIFHSLQARRLAMLVIRGNRENWPGYSRDEREERYVRMAPSDRDLDIQVDWSKVGNDDAVVHIQFNFNVN
jgi:hypothetical protein